MEKISVRLQQFQRLPLIEELMRGIESVLKDRTRWRGTARAVGALYGGESATAIAGKVEYERAQANITLRALVEAAVCECPIVAGMTPDGHAIDELFGLMWTLLELGRDSQMIYHGLASKWVTIYPSGAYAFKADSLEEMGKPFAIANWKASFDAAAADYEQWVQQKESQNESDRTGEFYSDGFVKAFSAEYHISPAIMQKIIGALYDVAIDMKSVVVVIDRAEIMRRCIAAGVSAEMIDAFLKAFSLSARPTWAPQAPYAAPKDVEPWRFERRLSVMLRPLIECAIIDGATSYVYGLGTLRDSIIYILDATITGKFEKDVFHSKEMRSYLGGRIDALGRGFTEEVATKLRALGWQVKTEVKMSVLGAGKRPDLGDIDVLAWRQDGHVLAVECKRLKGVRTIAEIARTCNRFAGNTGDLLHKHLRRVDWMEQNMDKWINFIKMPHGINIQLHCPLVTNVVVPFRYLKGLPFDPKKIWPFDEIEDCLGDRLRPNRKP
jgi:hypothetical protein